MVSRNRAAAAGPSAATPGAPKPAAAVDGGDRALPRPRALVGEVYNAILDRITSLEIAPGARINMDTLARELGVSPTPVRDA